MNKEISHMLIDFENGFWSCKQLRIEPCEKISDLMQKVQKAKGTDIVKPIATSPYGKIFPYFAEEDWSNTIM